MLLKNLLYILQGENYNIKRFLKFAYSHLKWQGLEKRKKLVWTLKASLIFLLSLLIILGIIVLFLFKFGILGLFIIIPLILLLPFVISASLLIIQPLDIYLKNKKIKKAKSILEKNKLIIIGITGSYGKTSAKEILGTILKEKFRIIKTPENINTDIGIADFIIKNKDEFKNYDILIIEMGAYKIGDIAKICDYVKPDYSILTGINESHLERFGSLENIIKAKFELAERTKKLAILNFDDKNVKNNYNRFKINNFTGISKNSAKNIKIKENFGGIEFESDGVKFETKLLALHNIGLILLCIEIARNLGVNMEEIKRGIKKTKPIKHRLEPIHNAISNIWVIDDSYNANLASIKSGIEVLNRAKKRKIVLTPGIVELGKKTQEIHKIIGELYAKNVDLVLLVKNSATDFIIDGLEKNNFSNYKIYESAQKAHDDLKNILKTGDTIIFQNDLPDIYL